jgi:hypothetical protein
MVDPDWSLEICDQLDFGRSLRMLENEVFDEFDSYIRDFSAE